VRAEERRYLPYKILLGVRYEVALQSSLTICKYVVDIAVMILSVALSGCDRSSVGDGPRHNITWAEGLLVDNY
jgi:hypothetical protein